MGGARWDRATPALPIHSSRRSVAPGVPACLARRVQRRRPDTLAQRRLRGRRATKAAAGERLARRASRCAHLWSSVYAFSGPASGVAGVRGGDLTTGQVGKQASFTRSVKEEGPAIPRHGQGPLSSYVPATPA
jgi:hypothetical protein